MVQRYTTMLSVQILSKIWGCRNHDRMVVGFITTCAIISPPKWQGILDTTLCDKVCQWLAIGWCFSPDTPVSSTNKTDCYDFTEILLKVVLNTITHTLSLNKKFYLCLIFLHTCTSVHARIKLLCKESDHGKKAI